MNMYTVYTYTVYICVCVFYTHTHCALIFFVCRYDAPPVTMSADAGKASGLTPTEYIYTVYICVCMYVCNIHTLSLRTRFRP